MGGVLMPPPRAVGRADSEGPEKRGSYTLSEQHSRAGFYERDKGVPALTGCEHGRVGPVPLLDSPVELALEV